MDDPALLAGITELCAAYADCLDDDRLEEWPDFFVEDCRYRITNRADYAEGLPHGVIYAGSKRMLVDRVTAAREANIFERHHYRHVLGPLRVDRIAEGVAEAHASVLVLRIMHDGATSIFASGRYVDRIDVAHEPFRFVERTIVLDSDKIDTLLVIPL